MGDTPSLAFYDDVRAMFGDACGVPLPSSPTPTPVSRFRFRVDNRVSSTHDIDKNKRIGNAGDDVSNGDENGNENPPSHPSAPFATANGASPFFTFPVPHYPKPKTENKKKRNRPNLSIETGVFIYDENDQGPDSTPNPSPKKKSKKTGRTSLNEMSSKNSPTPKYLDPNTGFPFPFNPEDPNFEETENFCYPQAAPRPSNISRPQSARPRTRAQQRAHSSRSRTAPAFGSFPRPSVIPDPIPVCMVLYNLLEIKDYKASDEEIKAAYKKMGLIFHPDKVNDEDKEIATACMQQINSARDVLLDKERRKMYHKTGKLPWLT